MEGVTVGGEVAVQRATPATPAGVSGRVDAAFSGAAGFQKKKNTRLGRSSTN